MRGERTYQAKAKQNTRKQDIERATNRQEKGQDRVRLECTRRYQRIG